MFCCFKILNIVYCPKRTIQTTSLIMEFTEMPVILFVVVLMVTVTPLTAEDMQHDAIDNVLNKMLTVTAENCMSKSRRDLELATSNNYVSQIPMYHKSLHTVTYSNRTLLLQAHNAALIRSFHFSFILQALNSSQDFMYQPSILYYYMSTSADVSASPSWTSGSSIWFDNNRTYPNWLNRVYFNQTIPLFGVGAIGTDIETIAKWIQEPRPQGDSDTEANYTDPQYKGTPYTRYDEWDSWWTNEPFASPNYAYTYSINIKKAYAPGVFASTEKFSFYGTPLVEDFQPPVRMSRLYFDCGRSNKWIVSMTSPIVEVMPRYVPWIHLRKPSYVAVIGMDVDFEKIDINPCPISDGNKEPNMFANTARCRNTTRCEPLHGFGFRRDGYQCVCKAGLYYPWDHNGPFKGADIEKATEEQYNNGSFDCVTAAEMEHYAGQTLVDQSSTDSFDVNRWMAAQLIFEIINNTTNDSCDREQMLSQDAAYGANTQFETQGRAALRLAHFISNFLQNVYTLSSFLKSVHRYDDRETLTRLKEMHMFSEVIANVMGDFRISGFGVFYDRNMFDISSDYKRELFGPFAFKRDNEITSEVTYEAIDFAGYSDHYVDQIWFKSMKGKWRMNLDDLEVFTTRPTDPSGTEIVFMAPTYTDGEWSRPYFSCQHGINDWLLNYTVPFFGPNSTTTDLEFKGLVVVAVKLKYLDINQCPDGASVHNTFKNTAKCDVNSQQCMPITGKGFTFGSYKCECRHGYQYPLSNVSGIDGGTMEEQYQKKMQGEINRYDELGCNRITSRSTTTVHPISTPDTSTASSCVAIFYLSVVMAVPLLYRNFVV